MARRALHSPNPIRHILITLCLQHLGSPLRVDDGEAVFPSPTSYDVASSTSLANPAAPQVDGQFPSLALVKHQVPRLDPGMHPLPTLDLGALQLQPPLHKVLKERYYPGLGHVRPPQSGPGCRHVTAEEGAGEGELRQTEDRQKVLNFSLL